MRTFKRDGCSILSLVLKGKWFDMIENGKKREEYRDATDYWDKRISWWWCRKEIPRVVEFRHGYAREARRMAFAATNAIYRDSAEHPDWGEPAERHFVIKLGERIELER